MSKIITYRHEKYRYFWAPLIKSWVVYTTDKEGSPKNDTEYFANKQSMLHNHPAFKFIKTDE